MQLEDELEAHYSYPESKDPGDDLHAYLDMIGAQKLMKYLLVGHQHHDDHQVRLTSLV